MQKLLKHRITVALIGNPNVGKSTLFNAVTGSRQHTGNWPGKTVGLAQGRRFFTDTEFLLTDLPGTYSLQGSSKEEQVTADYLSSHEPDCTVVVCDGSCLERCLLLAVQILKEKEKVVLCVNLMDEAAHRGITVDEKRLCELLQVPVVLTSAGDRESLRTLLEAIKQTALSLPRLRTVTWDDPVTAASEIASACIHRNNTENDRVRRQVDRMMVSRRFGIPLLFLLVFLILWLTIWGANYPAQLLEDLFGKGYLLLYRLMAAVPQWLRGILLDGVYSTCTTVLSVMLPPMAIFFLLFSVLEDVGYLPRMAFLLDPCMARCGGCGKQALTLCMGLGCNAVGVMGCRIIDSPRERLSAMLTNAMVPCNGRFPTLILLGSLFFSGIGAAAAVALCVALGAVGATVSAGVLNKIPKGSEPGVFLMEIPPFRRPRLGKILRQSLLEHTLSMALRTMKVAAPAGVILWLASRCGLMSELSAWLEPVGGLLGMSGVILMGFLFSLPANELLIPVILMALTGAGLQTASGMGPREMLLSHMSLQSAVCTMVFTLFHWPCATTLLTVRKETGSMRKTAVAALLPTAVGVVLCTFLQFLL